MVRRVIVVMLAMVFVAAHSQNPPAPSFQPKDGFVPDTGTAVKIAEAVLIPVYGEKKILSERPFNATLQGDVWTVAGTVHCDPPGARCVGGSAEVKISKSSGQILQMGHYK
jgi:NTF2 fold immunity protein